MRERKSKVLITSNPMNHEGGVVAFYDLLFARFDSARYELTHQPLGSRMKHYHSPRKKRVLYPLYCAFDLSRLLWRLCRSRDIRIVQVNPSLIPVPLVRDGCVILLAKLLRRKVVVLFHGWKQPVVEYLRQHRGIRWLFRQVYGRCDIAVVLADRFRRELMEFATPRNGVHVTTTMYDGRAILPATDRRNRQPGFLFLGRVSRLKGMGELVEAARILRQQGGEFELTIVGNGDAHGSLEQYEALVRARGLCDCVRFLGRLTGKDKFQAYADADVFVLPSWTEGCPTSALEALGSGLFVLSTDVGALAEVIEDRKNGRFVRCRDAEDLAEKMAWTCEHIDELREGRQRIRDDASRRFEVNVVMKQLERIYDQLLD